MPSNICPCMQKRSWSYRRRGFWAWCEYFIRVSSTGLIDSSTPPIRFTCFTFWSHQPQYWLYSEAAGVLLTHRRDYIDNLFTGIQLSSTCIMQDIKEIRDQTSSWGPCTLLKHPLLTSVYNSPPQQLYSYDRSRGLSASLLQKSFITGASSREVNQPDISSGNKTKKACRLVGWKVNITWPSSVEPMARGL